MDMEFVQFHPTGMVWPPGVQGLLVTEAVRGEGGILRNKLCERFMEKYDPKRMELSTRDVVARSIYTEVKEGRGTEHGGAYLDISHKPAEYVKKASQHVPVQRARRWTSPKPHEVGPTCHYMMGGIRVDAETAQSTVTGLSRPAEAAAGLFGSNCLGGIRLPICLCLLPGWSSAAEHARRFPVLTRHRSNRRSGRELLAPFSTRVPRVLRDSPRLARKSCRARRNFPHRRRFEKLAEFEDLKACAAKASVEGSRLFNPGWHLARELKSMLTISEAVALSALARTESRGAHSRIDFPNYDPVWEKKHNIIVREGSEMKRRESPVEEMPDDLKQFVMAD
jgi:succinate dehydrogenase / fumarate reductase flavoprotein subunit